MAWTGGRDWPPSDGMPVPGLALEPMIPPWYCELGLGDVADETEEESKDLVEGFGERGYG